MYDYILRMLAHCEAELKRAESERNPVLINYYTARIEEMEENR